jgi:hypothetical protein
MGRPAPKVDKHQTCSREASLRANPNDTEASDGLIPRTIRKLIKSCAVDVLSDARRSDNERSLFHDLVVLEVPLQKRVKRGNLDLAHERVVGGVVGDVPAAYAHQRLESALIPRRFFEGH